MKSDNCRRVGYEMSVETEGETEKKCVDFEIATDVTITRASLFNTRSHT